MATSDQAFTLRTMAGLDLVTLGEIARMLGVAKSTANNYTKRPDFPAAVAELPLNRVWLRSDVEAWAAEHLPLPRGRPPKTGS